jgi:hypothetical protein
MEQVTIVVQREKVSGKLVTGTLTVNGHVLGRTYENADVMVGDGLYTGRMRYKSGHNFVQGPFGAITRTGDFLLEVGGVPGRTAILFHGGNKPRHSRGCILLGAVRRDPKTQTPVLEQNHPLRKLRTFFYETEAPNASPAKNVTIVVKNINACYP